MWWKDPIGVADILGCYGQGYRHVHEGHLGASNARLMSTNPSPRLAFEISWLFPHSWRQPGVIRSFSPISWSATVL